MSSYLLIETRDGLILLTRQQVKARVRADLSGLNLVEELVAERRAQADAEDAA
jgi:hypothetical protein